MQWQSLSDFWAMGGYGGYVWGSFGVMAAGLAAESAALVLRRRRAVRAVQDAAEAGL